MADYYPLIKRAASGQAEASPEERAKVYERAREALLRHLRAADPPLSEADIARERLALDAAVRRVEDEILLSGSPPPVAPPQAPPPQRPSVVSISPLPRPPQPQPPLREPEPEGYDEEAAPAMPERPRVVAAGEERKSGRGQAWRFAVVGGVVGLVIAGVAVIAILNKDDPDRYNTPPAPTSDPSTAGGKLNERIGEKSDAGSPPAQQPQRQAGSGERQGAPGPSQAPLPVAQRAILYEESPDNPQVPKTTIGRAVWRLETVPVEQGKPADTAVQMDAEFPEMGMSVGLVLRRNQDPAFPASHTIEVRFGFKAGGGPVAQMGAPEFKAEENTRGAPLLAAVAPVTQDYFLIALSNFSGHEQQNLDLIRERNWIDIPIRFANGRRAVVTIEKGISGNDAIKTALERWH